MYEPELEKQMKLRLLLGTVIIGFGISLVQAQEAPRLIVRGDDMGYSHSGNLALIESSINGIQTSIEVIVPSPWFPEAVKLLNDNPDIDVGIHLAITSEWDNVKWRPVTWVPSLVDEDGYFFPMSFPNENYPGLSIQENNWKIDEIEQELRAQIELAQKKIPGISHISAHMGFTWIDPSIRELTNQLAIEYGINIDLEEMGVEYVSYKDLEWQESIKASSETKQDAFIGMLKALEPGKTYMFLDHPGYDNTELRAISHLGYETVAIDRQGVTDVFTSTTVKSVIEELGIKLISYRDLVEDK